MHWTFEPEKLAAILESAGFDAMIFDDVRGVFDGGGENRQVYVDSTGHLRYQYSVLSREETSTASVGGLEVRIEKTTREINNLYGQLDSTLRLVDFLREAPILLGKEK
jgi:hypothetical protein